MLESDAGDLSGRELVDLLSPPDRETFQLHSQAALDGERSSPILVSLRSAHGDPRQVALAVESFVLSSSQEAEMEVILLDMSGRQEARLESSEGDQLRRVIANVLPVAVSYAGSDGRYEFCNRQFEEWHALARHGAEGRAISEVMDGAVYAALRSHLRSALSGRAARFEGALRFPGVGRRIVSILYAPDWSPDGKLRGFYEFIDDRTDLESARVELRKAASQAALAEERERRSLAADLHDGAGQLLSLASIKLRELEENHGGAADRRHQIDEIAGLIQEARESITSLSFELSPPILYDVGLVAAAEWLAEKLGEQFGLVTEIEQTGYPLELDEAKRATLFRALRELLINVAKHAQSKQAFVTIDSTSERLRLTVRDHGVGFDPNSHAGRFGLLNILDRIGTMGGRVDIDAAPGEGAAISIELPRGGGGAS